MSNLSRAAAWGAAESHNRVASSLRFDWAMALLGAWYLGGLFLDGWAHSHGKVDSTFFTPWHAVFYAGFFAEAGLIVVSWLRNLQRGYDWQRALPAGYLVSLAGGGIFFVGGIGDMVWHELFGVERDIEALVSPTHLILALGMLLILSGPLRSAWSSTNTGTMSWYALGPVIFSSLYTLSLLTFFLGYGHPFVDVWPTVEAVQRHPVQDEIVVHSIGLAGALLQTLLMMGFILFIIQRWQMPFGALSLIIIVNLALVTITHDEYRLIPAAIVAGLAADGLAWWLKPSAERVTGLRLFAFGVPAVLYLAYFVLLNLLGDNTWSIHLWVGAIVLAGAAGLLLSYGYVPPVNKTEATKGSSQTAHIWEDER